MSKKVVSYQQLLKEAISEFDTSNNVDVKGPMLDPILSYEGDGELPTYKDAASVLERYYFNEKQDKGVEVSEADYENDKGEKSKSGSEHTEGPGGEEQAGTSDAATIPASKDEKGKDIAKEGVVSEKEWDDDDVPKKKKYTDESDDLSEDIENAVIEKLIAEMEEEDDEDEDKEEVEESDGNPSSDFKGVPDAAQEKKAKGPEDDTKGVGGEGQAGTGTKAGQVPDRKDRHDQMVKPKNYSEDRVIEKLMLELDDEEEGDDEEGGEEEEKDLDVDAKTEAAGFPGGPDEEDADSEKDEVEESLDLEEAFELFKEEIESDEEEEEDDDEEKEEK
ncbi:MAG: hypothetical protein KGD64_04045 [Candidatus Heimdallarchaeota archaeon]|nr:hypothetical protein [Candidatus Heimdallarchaeota archaeon]